MFGKLGFRAQVIFSSDCRKNSEDEPELESWEMIALGAAAGAIAAVTANPFFLFFSFLLAYDTLVYMLTNALVNLAHRLQQLPRM